jgi:hypothetical protein
VLVTLTGVIGTLIFATWAGADSVINRRRAITVTPVVVPADVLPLV